MSVFKKLQNLLFEEEEEVVEEVIPEPEPVKRPAQTYTERPAEQRPVMQQVKERPVQQQAPAVPNFMINQRREEPVQQVYEEPKQEKPAGFGLTVDDVNDETMNLHVPGSTMPQTQPQQRPAAPKPAAPARPKEQASAKPRKQTPAYEFTPVISPMFGVDEKDIDALQTTGKAKSPMTSPGMNDNVSKVISPIYGMSKEAEPSRIQDTVEKSNRMEETVVTEDKQETEDALPDFSLDDILKIRDEEFRDSTEQPTLFDEIIDETTLLDSDNLRK